jgi:hypothetical protein
MNDRDRQLVEEVLRAAGTAGTKGWDYLIRFMVWDGIVGALAGAALIGAALYAFKLILKWKPKDGGDSDMAHLARGAAMAVLCVVLIAFVCGVASSIVQVLAPQGAAIHMAIRH